METNILGVKFLIFPELQLCWWLYVLMFLEFFTAYFRERAGGRKFTFANTKVSITKTIQYTAFLMLLWCLINISGQKLENMIIAMNGAYAFLIIIESKQIAENIRDISPESNFSRFILAPFLGLLEAIIKKRKAQL